MPTQFFDTIREQTETYIEFLCNICAFEAKATDKTTIDAMLSYISEFASQQGFCVTRTAMEACGDFLCIDLNKGAQKGCVFLAHTDTVHEKGAFGSNPVIRLQDRIIAPGSIDCKGGIAIALLAMKALAQNGYRKHVRLLLTSDEEMSNALGGQAEIDYFTQMCEGFPYAINCETTEKDEVVISRKGIFKYRMDIIGSGGHSGIHYFSCKNPIEEAAHKILAFRSESSADGVTYSCNIIRGGTYPNIIPDQCSLTVDVRVKRYADMQRAEETVGRIASASYIGDTRTTLTCLSKRPPMEKNEETDALFERLLAVCHKYDLGSLTPIESGGGSDSCYTQAAGIPSICGMGGSGAFCHTNREYILTASVPLRAKILAAFLCEE